MTTLQKDHIEDGAMRLVDVVTHTPLEKNEQLSKRYQATVYLKREDLQIVRSYKLRGAYNKIAQISDAERSAGVVCASAGNHAQGVAYACAALGVKGAIFMPRNTPKQKINRVRHLGGEWITMELAGDSFDESATAAKAYCADTKGTFVHPFDDPDIAAGQGTVAKEIVVDLGTVLDVAIMPIGGGGLIAGMSTYFKATDPACQVVGVEPAGAPSMSGALKAGEPITLPQMEKFVDGASVQTIGSFTFAAAKDKIDEMVLVPEGQICQEMIALYQNDGIVTEPAGAMSVAALEHIKDKIVGKTVVCVVSGGNNDISRYAEIIDRSLIYQGLKHYFIVNFPQRPGALRDYLDTILGPNDDITLFEYIKKSNREQGPALIGIELSDRADYQPLLARMDASDFTYELLDPKGSLFKLLV